MMTVIPATCVLMPMRRPVQY